MHITIDRAALLRELTLHGAIAAKGGQIPILGNVALGATTGEPKLNLESTDLEISLRSSVGESVVKAGGSVTIPARRILDYVAKLPDGDVEIKLGANNWLSITAGRAKSRMAGMDSASWPDLPLAPEGWDVKMAAALFARLIRQTAYAISTEETRFSLNGALIEVGDGTLRMIATDGHRMAIFETPMEGGPLRCMFPRKALLEASKLSGTAAVGTPLGLALSQDRIHVGVDSRLITARNMSGNFPDYKRVLPTHEHWLVIDRAALLGALERVVGFSDERSRAIRFEVAGGCVTLKATTADIGDSEESVDAVEMAGETLQIGLNANYLLDVLRSLDVEKVQIGWKNGQSALDVRPVGGPLNGRCVIMPMRVA